MRGVVTVLLLLVGAEPAAAQLCVGNTNFALSHFHSSVDVNIDNLAHLYTAEFRYRYQHLFAGLQYGRDSGTSRPRPPLPSQQAIPSSRLRPAATWRRIRISAVDRSRSRCSLS